MLPFSNYFDIISVSCCLLFQGVSIDIEPVKRFSNGVLVLHPETQFSVITNSIGVFYNTIFILEDIAYI